MGYIKVANVKKASKKPLSLAYIYTILYNIDRYAQKWKELSGFPSGILQMNMSSSLVV